MSLKPCKECGHKVSTKAETCPNCGAPIPRKSGCLGTLIFLFIGGILLLIFAQGEKDPKTIDTLSSQKETGRSDEPAKQSLNRTIQAEPTKQTTTPKNSMPSQNAPSKVQEPDNSANEMNTEQGQINRASKEKRKNEKLTQEKVKKDMDAYIATLQEIGIGGPIVTSISVQRFPGSFSDVATITVGNSWHYEPYQMRLQAAQNLWKMWANIHSPQNPDHARIKLVDENENEVGGSRFLAGSFIWVQE